MKRFHIHLRVANINDSVRFYSNTRLLFRRFDPR
jgi:hypothetical protein